MGNLILPLENYSGNKVKIGFRTKAPNRRNSCNRTLESRKTSLGDPLPVSLLPKSFIPLGSTQGRRPAYQWPWQWHQSLVSAPQMCGFCLRCCESREGAG